MNRKQRRALGRPSARAGFGTPDRFSGREIARAFADAVAHHSAGALAEAERDYRRLLAHAPDHAGAQGRLGAVLMAQGKVREAIAHLERALALEPRLFEALGNLAQAYMALGQTEPAVDVLARALEIQETPQGQALFADWIKTGFRGDVDARLRRLVVRALVEGWAKPRELTTACIGLIKCGGAVTDCIRRAEAAWPRRLTAAELFGASGPAAAFADEVLCRLLECDPITDIGMERFLTNVRFAMLERARSEHATVGERELEFFGAVSRQCFINEYVYPALETEAEWARDLQSALAEKIATGAVIPPLWPLAVGAYAPLFAVPNSERLRERAWPQSVATVIVQQSEEPVEERRLAAAMPALTSIDDDVSRAVRQQYEENPYPRWATPRRAATRAHGSPATANQPHNVLIAGCGTGLSATEFARQMPHAHILAVDLSLASLGYAKRMAQSFDLGNIEFAQADIMKLGSLGRTFDFIDSSGVLHHMGDPWLGWRVLLSLLQPGGCMQVGLYSGLGRRDIVAARAFIAQRGYRPIAEDIRRCRQDIIAAADPPLRAVADRHDFYTMSECRDLLFHVQEHRITLAEIKSFIASNNLKFAGFMLDPGTMRRFAERFPEAAASTDLDRWQAFETDAPNTFAGMYQFQVRKPLTRASAPAVDAK